MQSTVLNPDGAKMTLTRLSALFYNTNPLVFYMAKYYCLQSGPLYLILTFHTFFTVKIKHTVHITFTLVQREASDPLL